jgi:hypothetical protein
MKTIHWAEVQRGLLSKRADKLVRLAGWLVVLSVALTVTLAILGRVAAGQAVSYVIFTLAVLAVALLIAAFGLVLPLPLIVHELKEMDEVVSEQTRRHF